MEDNFMKNNFCKMHGFVLKLSAVARVGAKNRSFGSLKIMKRTNGFSVLPIRVSGL